jgi:hypothetical protein
MGAAGDMLTAALLELLPDHEHSHERSHEHHHHSGMHEIEHIIADLKLPAKVEKDVLAVYGLIAEAESHAPVR